MDELRYWPFAIRPEAEWNAFDREFVGFLQSAFNAGFKPRVRSDNFIVAESAAGRHIVLVFRGRRNGWEVCPRDAEGERPLGPIYGLSENACVCVRPPFSAAGHFALEWLRGRALPSLLSEFDFEGGSPPGIKRRLASESTQAAGAPSP